MGPTKRGKGTKLMAVADAFGLPVAVHTSSASPAEVTLVQAALAVGFVEERPHRLIGDKAYDSDPLGAALAEQNIEMIAPHRRGRDKLNLWGGRGTRADRLAQRGHATGVEDAPGSENAVLHEAAGGGAAGEDLYAGTARQTHSQPQGQERGYDEGRLLSRDQAVCWRRRTTKLIPAAPRLSMAQVEGSGTATPGSLRM